MRIDAGHNALMPYSAFGQQGTRVAENRRAGEENHLPGVPAEKAAEKIKSAETTLSAGAAPKETQPLTYSNAIKAPAGAAAVGMGHADATAPGAKAIFPSAAADEANAALDGMPFAKTGDKALLPAQAAQSDTPAADEAGKEENTEKSGTGKTGDAENAPENDPGIKNEIRQLEQREQEVIAHEAAHKAVGGQYASAATYTYTTGPDDKRYIDGGEVSIRTPSTNDPHEALRLAELVKRAALAPANPSGQDLSVAASATQKAAAARTEISKLAREEAAEKRTASQAEKSEKTEETASARTGDASSGSKDGKKPSGAGLSGAAAAHGQKAADAYASLSNIHQPFGSSGKLHAIG